MKFRNGIYATTCLLFTMVIGAGIYEHTAVWPAAYAAPPRSLTMFQGEYGLNAEAFWKAIHPITLLFFLVTLMLHWNTKRRRYVLVPLIAYAAVLAITFAFFVPELMQITSTPYADTVDESLISRGERWINLSLVRAGVLIASAITLFLGLTQPVQLRKVSEQRYVPQPATLTDVQTA